MPYIAPIVGFTDNLGYLRCADCATEPTHQVFPVYGDNRFGPDDCCDVCRKQLQHVKTADYVYTPWPTYRVAAE